MSHSYPSLLLILLALALSATTPGCSRTDSARQASARQDTIETTNPVEKSGCIELPDTAFASLSALRFKTTIVDSATSGRINCTADLYTSAPGALTFRGNAFRNAEFGGTVKGTPSNITVEWTFLTGISEPSASMGSWGGGTGWTGQPLYIEWPDSCVAKFKGNGLVSDNFNKKEIIVGSLDGKVYFIDFDSGNASREPIETGNPIKGTVSLDPTLNGNLYVGHGIPVTDPFGASVIDLYKGKVTQTKGRDPKAPRGWGAYDSSALRVGQFLFRPGENGVLYKYSVSPGKLKIHSTMSYTGSSRLGFEASMSAYANYGFTADNSGNIVCVNLNTMRPVWRYSTGDDTDASPVLALENNHPYLYVGSEIDKQGAGTTEFVKIDALNGKRIWSTKFDGRMEEVSGKHFDGGFYATALPGSGNCSHLVFSNVVRNLDGQNGQFVAMDRTTGKVLYATDLKYYAWSSPVGFVNEKGEMFIVTADCAGRLYIIEGLSGKILFCKGFGANFESSPVVSGNKFVVGSRGKKIYKFSID